MKKWNLSEAETHEVVKAKKTLSFIFRALKPEGDFTLWDHAFPELSEVTLGRLKDRIEGAGFVLVPEKSLPEALFFRKKLRI